MHIIFRFLLLFYLFCGFYCYTNSYYMDIFYNNNSDICLATGDFEQNILKRFPRSSVDRHVINIPRNLLPRGYNENNDRIMEQLNFKPNIKSGDIKSILLYNGLNGKPEGSEWFRSQQCPVSDCQLTGDMEAVRDGHKEVDAVIFDNAVWGMDKFKKRSGQVWILNVMESTYHTVKLTDLGSNINWTATYRQDSTLVVPYDKIIHKSSKANSPRHKNYAVGKSKLAAIFVSNCYSYSGRLAYVRELQRYVTVDVYGYCGNMTCPRDKMDACHQLLNNTYKFYLAFENSLCKNYISEKFFWHALRNDVVPVVMGATYEEYLQVSPPDSFIHVDNFTSPRQLAEYLTFLDNNDHAYNKYLAWKQNYTFMDSKFWCRLCTLLHTDLPVTWYDDIHQWYKGEHNCRTNDMYDDISLLT